MDIWLIGTDSGTHIRSTSVHGMLWLQTHFEEEHWESIADNLVKIPNLEARDLAEDATAAGININYLPSLNTANQL